MSRKGAETQRDAHGFALTRWVNACLLASASSLRLCAFAPLRDIPSPDLGLAFKLSPIIQNQAQMLLIRSGSLARRGRPC